MITKENVEKFIRARNKNNKLAKEIGSIDCFYGDIQVYGNLKEYAELYDNPIFISDRDNKEFPYRGAVNLGNGYHVFDIATTKGEWK